MCAKRIAILTSGGDAPGMNAAIRSIVRIALNRGIEVYAIYEGYQGLIDGGDRFRKLTWDSVGGILHRGGTVIGTARCDEFRTREGRRKAVHNLVERGVDNLVVIGGDGSLTGANVLRQEWQSLLTELAEMNQITPEIAKQYANLFIVGLVGSIDNDMHGTDMTIGADTALHRITEAIDAISSTAASHQRTFVVEVMGRNCGYLALMGCLATGADWVLIPENPPEVDNWEKKMCDDLKAGRQAGRRDSIVIIAEGARDRNGKPITSTHVMEVLKKEFDEEVRVTVLGHVQRGGTPSAFDRNLGTLMGAAAVDAVMSGSPNDEPQLISLRGNRIVREPLMKCVEQSKAVGQAIADKNYERALELRGNSFRETLRTLKTLLRSLPHEPIAGQKRLRLAVLNSGAPAPGMNAAIRAAIRIGLDKGHIMLGVNNGFQGLIDGEIEPMDWMSVNGWASAGGSELGANREVPSESTFYPVARNLERYEIEGLLVIGGWTAYQGAYRLYKQRENFPAFNIPIICLPASINNNLPGSELSIGADTALNNIMWAVDRVKQSAIAQRRCFVVEVMGRYCGYLALMSGLATGAERVYLHEEGITLRDLQNDLDHLMTGFELGKRLGLMIRNEKANPIYTADFVAALFEEEGGSLFDVRQTILGHVQQGGDPSPFDRIQATRLAARCVEFLIENANSATPAGAFIGLESGGIRIHNIEEMPQLMDETYQRPKKQWWLDLLPISRMLAQPAPESEMTSV
ncbi:MAG: 6-phosphofructokinase [Chloroflexota bacterium]|nr:6-phosphofructokinase [Chloroflexota bacterium]NOG65344.1 6-phosphofructokinase [Chloroflexota bacterium]GIK66732.1 MAG: 6-phosphofructokinase [Chloroflexota bacterium]